MYAMNASDFGEDDSMIDGVLTYQDVHMCTILISLRDARSITEMLKDGLVSMILLWEHLGEHSGQPGRLTVAESNAQ